MSIFSLPWYQIRTHAMCSKLAMVCSKIAMVTDRYDENNIRTSNKRMVNMKIQQVDRETCTQTYSNKAHKLAFSSISFRGKGGQSCDDFHLHQDINMDRPACTVCQAVGSTLHSDLGLGTRTKQQWNTHTYYV